MRATENLNLGSGDRNGRRGMIKHVSSWINLPTGWERGEIDVTGTKPEFPTWPTERIIVLTDIKISRAKSSLGRKRMNFDLDRLICSTFENQPTNVRKATNSTGTVSDTLCLLRGTAPSNCTFLHFYGQKNNKGYGKILVYLPYLKKKST